jgi:hypothetical protein
VGDQQPGDGPRANEPAGEGPFRRSRASRDAGKDDSLRSSDRGASPADGDDTPGGPPLGPATADQKQGTGRRLWKQLTGSPFRKALTALGTVLTAVVAAIAAVLVPDLINSGNPVQVIVTTRPPSGPIVTTRPPSGPPIPPSTLGCATGPRSSPLLASVDHETSLDHPGLATVFPGTLNLSKVELLKFFSKDNGAAWLAARGGYDGYTTRIKVTLTGCQPVRILSMRAVILTRSRPLAGTIFQPASQGGIVSFPLEFNLDSGSPVAMMLDNSGHSYNYFERNTFTLAPHEQHTFEIKGTTVRWAVTWKLDVEFLVDNRTVNETIENGRQPFRTSALLSPGSPYHPFPGYGVAYGACFGYGGQPWPTVCRHLTFDWVRVK